MWCKVQSPLERGSPQACAHDANPSILDLLPALSSPPLPLEEGREPPNQAWVSAAIVIGHRDEARTGLFLMKTVVSWTLDSSTGISLLMRNGFPQLQLPSSQMHFGPCRPGCLLLSTQKWPLQQCHSSCYSKQHILHKPVCWQILFEQEILLQHQNDLFHFP